MLSLLKISGHFLKGLLVVRGNLAMVVCRGGACQRCVSLPGV